MTFEELIRILAQNKILLTADGDRLRCNAPAGALTKEIRDAITTHKAALLGLLARNADTEQPPRPVDRARPLPLTFAQERLWFVEKLRPSHAYNLTAFRRDVPGVDPAILQQALRELMRRQESLRTSFIEVDGAPAQVIHPDVEPVVETIDLPAASSREEVDAVIAEVSQRHFDLTQAPLFRMAIIRTGDVSTFVLVMHHIISDGWSIGIFMDELSRLYQALESGQAPDVPELPVQYGDYACWQRDRLKQDFLKPHLDWWERKLGDLPPLLELPTDHQRPHVQGSDGASHSFFINPETAAALRALGEREGITLFVLLLAILKSLLFRYTGQKGIPIGSPVTERTHRELELLIGHFANSLVLRTDVTADMTVMDLLRAVRHTVLDAHEHAAIPFEQVVNVLRPARNLAHSPLFQVAFIFDKTPLSSTYDTVSRGAMFDLSLFMWESLDGRIGGTLQYNTQLFEPPTMERMAGHFLSLASQFAVFPQRRIGDLDLLQPDERKFLLEECNRTASEYPRNACVHDLFAEQVRLRGSEVALIEDGLDSQLSASRLTYAELDERTERLAQVLRAAGVGPEVCVAVVMDRSADAVVAFLAVLRAGGAYVPLDPSWPERRLQYILNDTAAAVLITRSRHLSTVEKFGLQTVLVDALPAAASEAPAERPQPNAESLAYVMYTSGSTGEPKGVSVVHRAITRLVRNTNYLEFSAGVVILSCAPVTFDAATFEIWGALLNGGTLVVLRDSMPTPHVLRRMVNTYGINTLWLTAGLFQQLVDTDVDAVAAVPQVLAGGDVLSTAHVNRLLSRPGRRVLINGYGPTENTTFTCCHRMESGDHIAGAVPIGRPLANTTVHVLDGNMQPVPVGVSGELWTGGDGLARGYLNQPELTQDKFVPDPFSPVPGARLYRTGDIVRRLPDGAIEFVTRTDSQVKIRGFRIDFGEVEAAISKHAAVRECVVTARTDANGSKYLCCHLALHAPADNIEADLREALTEWLPDYMIPSTFVVIDQLPLSGNGKIDRQALPEPQNTPASRRESVAPRTELERVLLLAWQSTLGVSEIGVRDSFFDLGGHSLLAVKLFWHLEKRFGVLPLSLLFEAPTIEHMAARLSSIAAARETRSLVPIQPSGTRPPLFLVPGVGGNVICFAEVAAALGPSQPVYGLQSVGLDGTQPLESVQQIAAHFVSEIRTLQPSGPYHLGGACMGGAIAWEIAQQLRSAGEEVAIVVLMETWPPDENLISTPAPAPNLVRMRLSNAARALFQSGPEARRAYVTEKLGVLAKVLRGERSGISDLSDLYRANVAQANLRAFAQYRPKPYDGNIAMFLADQRVSASGSDPRLIWGELTQGRVTSCRLACIDSGDMLRGRMAVDLGTQLSAILSSLYQPAGAAA